MILEKLGIFGTEPADEKMILTGMLLGDPVLLIGEHGSAKTEIARVLSVALLEHSKTQYSPDEKEISDHSEFGILPEKWTQHAIYDCSKVQFEELIGFPNPTTFQSGYVNFVRSPITIWGKKIVILDEFNRQSRRQQNSLFELIRSRTIYGRNTGAKMIFACMNPYGMEGTEILDEALVDRMGCFIYTKGFNQLDDIVREDIIQRSGPSDSPGLREWADIVSELDSDGLAVNTHLAEIGKELTTIFIRAAEVYQQLLEEVGEAYSLFVNRFLSYFLREQAALGDEACLVSSRRASMMYRMLIGYRAMEVTLAELRGEEVSCIRSSFSDVLIRTIPIGISESSGTMSDRTPVMIASIVEMMESYFVPSDYSTVRASLDTLHEILTTNDMVRKSALLVDYLKENSPLEAQLWNEIVTFTDLTTKKGIQSAVLSLTLGNIVAYDKNILPQSIVGKVISTYKDVVAKIAVEIGTFNISGEDLQFKDKIIEEIERYKKRPFEKLYASLLWKALVENYRSRKQNLTEEVIFRQVKEVDMETSRLRDLLAKMSENADNLESSAYANKIEQLKVEEQCPETEKLTLPV